MRIVGSVQLQGPIREDLKRCIKDYCRRGKEMLSPQEVWQVMMRHLLHNKAFSLWLALDDKYRIQGFAMLRLIRDDGLEWEGDLWKVYIKPGADWVLDEGLPKMEEWFREQNASAVTFGTKRNPQAWTRKLRKHGYKVGSTIFTKPLEVSNDG